MAIWINFTVTPTYTLALDDLLANAYPAPLSAEDFENWLFYVEHEQESVQNLCVFFNSFIPPLMKTI